MSPESANAGVAPCIGISRRHNACTRPMTLGARYRAQLAVGRQYGLRAAHARHAAPDPDGLVFMLMPGTRGTSEST